MIKTSDRFHTFSEPLLNSYMMHSFYPTSWCLNYKLFTVSLLL